ATGATGFRGWAARPYRFWAGAARLTNKIHNVIGTIALVKRIAYALLMLQPNALASLFSNALPPTAASKALRRTLVSTCGAFAEIGGLKLGRVGGVVDTGVIEKLVVLVDEIGFRRHAGTEPVSNLVAWIFQNRERQFVLRSMSLNCRGIFSDVRIDTDDGDAF